MDEKQPQNGINTEVCDFENATVRELIVQLAATEEERRNAATPGLETVLTEREEAIVTALRTGPPTQMMGT